MKKNRALCLLLAVLMALSMAGAAKAIPRRRNVTHRQQQEETVQSRHTQHKYPEPETDRLDGSGGNGARHRRRL